MIEKGTLITWTLNSVMYTAKAGATAILAKDFDTANDEFVIVEWVRNELAGDQEDGGFYQHHFTGLQPVYDVNKTVEIVAPQSQLIEIMDIGKMLSVLPYGGEDPLYTRPFIQDCCYCAYGWTVAETNDIINAAVKMSLFKLI